MKWSNPLREIVTLREVANEVHDYAHCLATAYDPADIADEEGNASGDVRLQVHDGCASVHTGDACYDTDHRGAWGAGSIDAGASMRQCREVARDLIEQAANSIAERFDED